MLTGEDLCQPAPSPKGRIAPSNFPAVQENKNLKVLSIVTSRYMYRALTLGNFFRRKGRDKLSLASGINAATHRGLERREAGGAEAGIVAGPDVGAGVESQWCWWRGGKGEGKGFIQSKRSE
jgi:hypothetical protein